MSRLTRFAAGSTLLAAGTFGWARLGLAQPTTYNDFCWTPATKQLVYVCAPFQTTKDELRGSKGYCETNILLHRIFDCDCFARLVFHFRVMHAGEYKQSYREEGTGWPGFSNVLMARDFDCTACLEDARLSKYVLDRMMRDSYPALQMGRTTAEKVKTRADCVAPKYIAEFKAHPHVFEEQANFNRASEGCRAP